MRARGALVWLRELPWSYIRLSAASFLVPLAFSPVWGRVYPVSYFGTAGIVQTAAAMFSGWSTFAFHNALLAPSEDQEAFALGSAGILAAVSIAGVFAIGLLFFGDSFAIALGGEDDLAMWLWAVPILIALGAANLTLDQLMVRRAKAHQIVRATLIVSIFGAIVPLIGTLAPHLTNYIVLGGVLSSFIGVAIRFRLGEFSIDCFRLSPYRVKKAVANNARFPRDLIPGGFLSSVASQLPQLMIARAFGSDGVAQYARASSLLGIPSTLISNGVSALFMQQASSAYRVSGDCRAITRRTLLQLAMVMGLVYAVIAGLAPWLYPWFYGPQWTDAGALAQPLAISFFAVTVFSSVSGVLYFSRKTIQDLTWQAGRVVVLGLVLALSSATLNLWLVMLSLGIVNLVAYGSYAAIAYYFSRDRARA
jgi:O-antigen/teichoic acid export membrane protein